MLRSRMFSSKPDRAFRRYQQTTDPGQLAVVFDCCASELLALARHLASSEASAEDLVQDTFVTAIGAVDDFDPKLRVMPWLVGILANHARAARRRGLRALDTDRLPRAAPVTPPSAAQTAELEQSLLHCIAQLPATWQPVLHSYLDGARPQEIAADLHRHPSTVRSQIARGLALVRSALPVVTVGAIGASASAAPGRGLPAMRRVVLQHAQSRPAPLTTTAAASTGGGGLWVMAAGAAVAASLAVWAGSGAFAGDDPTPHPPEPGTAAAPTTARAAAPVTSTARREAGPRHAAAADPSPPIGGRAARTGIRLYGIVVDHSGIPVAGATVMGRNAGALAKPITQTGADGRFVATGVAPRLELHAVAAGHAASHCRSVIARPGVDVEVEFALRPPGHTVQLRLITLSGPALGPEAILVPVRSAAPIPLRRDEGNALVAADVAPGDYVIWAKSSDRAHAATRHPISVERDLVLDVTLDLAARVTAQLPVVVPGDYWLAASPRAPIPRVMRRWLSPRVNSSGGRCVLEGLAPGTYHLSVGRRDGGFTANREITVAAGVEYHWPVPEEALRVRVHCPTQPGAFGIQLYREGEHGRPVAATQTDADGRAVFAGQSTGRYDISISRAISVHTDTATPVRRLLGVTLDSAEFAVEITPAELPAAVLSGRIVDADGHPTAHAQVRASRTDRWGEEPVTMVLTGDDGHFTMTLPAGRHILRASCPGFEPKTLPELELFYADRRSLGDTVLVAAP